MSEHIEITLTESDRHDFRELRRRLDLIERLLHLQTKLLHQILAREPNWYPAPVGGSVTVR
jgi:hypothetical protein